ncbi:MAG: sulfatase-like hydrolase/transferase [Acidimicrobiales bacterium]
MQSSGNDAATDRRRHNRRPCDRHADPISSSSSPTTTPPTPSGVTGPSSTRPPASTRSPSTASGFDRCFVTNSLCTPSRAAILTGTYSHINGVYSLFTPIDASQPTFISLLREAGYKTAMIGKWHMGHGEGRDPQASTTGTSFPGRATTGTPPSSVPRAAARSRAATDIITDLATSWVESLDDDQPYCMLVWH